MHQISLSSPVELYPVKAHSFHKVLVCEIQLLVIREIVVGVECVCEPKIRDDDIAISVQQKILKLEISVHDSLLVEIAHTRDELCK